MSGVGGLVGDEGVSLIALEDTIERAARCSDRRGYIEYLRGLYGTVDDVCKRILLAVYLSREVDAGAIGSLLRGL